MSLDANGNDLEVVDITSYDAETVQMIGYAKEAASMLSSAYPAHLWAVGFHPGMCLAVKNMAIPGNYGFTIACDRIATASEFKKSVLWAGGEMLERCGMKRGHWDGEFATKLDGSDPRHFQTI